MSAWRSFRSLGWSAVCAWLLTGCGASVLDTSSGSGGNLETAGSGGGGGTAGAIVDGTGGALCHFGNKTYMSGQKFPAPDGCNQCSCSQNGTVACDEGPCPSACRKAEFDHGDALDRLRTCTPGAPNQCAGTVVDALNCGCSTPINDGQSEDLATLLSAQERYTQLQCSTAVCEHQCDTPANAYCSPDGRCQYEVSTAGRAACKVGGVVYPSGTIGTIPDPSSCNKCSCNNGALSCTARNCPIACPNQQIFASRCIACGPNDGCEVVEFDCLPTCTDTCADGECINGLCRTVCG